MTTSKYTIAVSLTHPVSGGFTGGGQNSVTYPCEDYAHNEDEGTLTLFGVPVRGREKSYVSRQVFLLKRVVGYSIRFNGTGEDL